MLLIKHVFNVSVSPQSVSALLCFVEVRDQPRQHFQQRMPWFYSSFRPLLAAMPFKFTDAVMMRVFFISLLFIFEITSYLSAMVPDTASRWLVTDHQITIP